MNKYELVIIVDAHKPQPEKDDILKITSDAVSKSGANVSGSQVWLEKQRFTFPIKKKWEGSYFVVNFEGASPVLLKIKEYLRLSEQILRSLIIRVA